MASPVLQRGSAKTRRRSLPAYGATGSGTAKTDDCTVTVAAGGAPQTAIDNAAVGAVVCVSAADYSTATLTVNKAVTVRATGEVKIKNAVVSAGATFEGFTVVGGAAAIPDTGIDFFGANNVIRNNLINGHGLQRGIYGVGNGSIVDHNTVTNVNNYGIQVGSSSNGIIISRNNIYDLYDTVGNGLDVDGMRIFGTNHVVRENYIHDIYVGNSVGAGTASAPHVDCFQNYQGTNLVAQNITYENNYGMRVDGMFIITKNNLSLTRTMSGYTIRGNVAEVYGWQVVILSGIDGATVENNTFFGAPKDGPCITVEHSPDSGAQSSGIRVQNNVLVRGKSTNAAVGDRSGNPTPDGTTVNSNNVTGVDSALVAADINHDTNPLHVTTPIIASDFTGYRARSLAYGTLVDQGAAMLTSGLTVDASGNPRVQGSAVDIGAYEAPGTTVMAIALRGTPTTSVPSALTTTLTINAPSGAADGDLLVWVLYSSQAVVPATPAGWTVLKTTTSTGISLAVFYRIASSEPTSYTHSTLTSAKWSSTMTAYSGVDTTTPIDATAPAGVAGTTAITFPAFTTVTAGAWVLTFGGIHGIAGAQFSFANGDQDALDVAAAGTATGTINPSITAGHTRRAATGPSTPTVTVTGTGTKSTGITAGIRPVIP